MNWLDNLSSDSEQQVAPTRLLEGHWQYAPDPDAPALMCRLVIDVMAPRVVAAQALNHGYTQDLDTEQLDELDEALFVTLSVHQQPATWGFTPCLMLPEWARPSFSDSQIQELERIEGYLIDAKEEQLDAVLDLRDAFLQGIGVTDRHMYRVIHETTHFGHKPPRSRLN